MAAARPDISVTLSPELRRLRREEAADRGAGGPSLSDPCPSRPDPEHAAACPAEDVLSCDPGPAAPDPGTEGGTVMAEAELAEPDACIAALWERIRLRRDGARPLIFKGIALLEEWDEAELLLADRPVTAHQRLVLYLRSDCGLVIEASRRLDGVESVMPVYLARSLDDATQVPRLLAGLDPWVLLLDPVGLAPTEPERGAFETFFGQAPQRLASRLRSEAQQ